MNQDVAYARNTESGYNFASVVNACGEHLWGNVLTDRGKTAKIAKVTQKNFEQHGRISPTIVKELPGYWVLFLIFSASTPSLKQVLNSQQLVFDCRLIVKQSQVLVNKEDRLQRQCWRHRNTKQGWPFKE